MVFVGLVILLSAVWGELWNDVFAFLFNVLCHLSDSVREEAVLEVNPVSTDIHWDLNPESSHLNRPWAGAALSFPPAALYVDCVHWGEITANDALRSFHELLRWCPVSLGDIGTLPQCNNPGVWMQNQSVQITFLQMCQMCHGVGNYAVSVRDWWILATRLRKQSDVSNQKW